LNLIYKLFLLHRIKFAGKGIKKSMALREILKTQTGLATYWAIIKNFCGMNRRMVINLK
jgi:hypothetical protein